MNNKNINGIVKQSSGGSFVRGASKKTLTVASLGTLLVSGGMIPFSTTAFADDHEGGTGPAGGSGNAGIFYHFYDQWNPVTNTPIQGYGEQSLQTLIAQAGGANAPGGQGNVRYWVEDTCRRALTKDRAATGKQSRVVGFIWSNFNSDNPWSGYGRQLSKNFHAKYLEWVNRGRPGIMTAANGVADVNAYYGRFDTLEYAEYTDPANNNPATNGEDNTVWCFVLSEDIPEMTYPLNITTDKVADSIKAGTTTPVSDTIHADNGGSAIRENITAKVILNWDGVEGVTRRQEKSVTITNTGDTRSPNFTPNDFGWKAWPKGRFWFDVQVEKQGRMRAAVDTADRDPRETWENDPAVPPVEKTVKSGTGNNYDELENREVMASGQTYNAEITANTHGYQSEMWMYDTIHTEEVWIGGVNGDDKSKLAVYDPDGNKVTNARFEIKRGNGKTEVVAAIPNIPEKYTGGRYKLVVPTYFKPTKADYTAPDDSKVCYTRTVTDCYNGNSKLVRKITPRPDKVWVIDENGALVAEDHDWINTHGCGNIFAAKYASKFVAKFVTKDRACRSAQR